MFGNMVISDLDSSFGVLFTVAQGVSYRLRLDAPAHRITSGTFKREGSPDAPPLTDDEREALAKAAEELWATRDDLRWQTLKFPLRFRD